MTIEAVPFGNTCDLACGYCYLHPQRDAGNWGPKKYDLQKLIAGLEAEGGKFTLHGGDPLQMPLDDLEALWQWGYERYRENAVQTHGATITPAHVDLAKRYNVHVGISVDGPGDMNDLRWAGTLDKTRRKTEQTHKSIAALCSAGVGCSVIVVLHRLNMDPARRDEFKAWLSSLDEMGVRGIRFHPMEVDNEQVRGQYQPSIAEYVEFYRDLHAFMRGLGRLRIDILQDIRYLLQGNDQQTTCTWNACDPYTTAAVRGVDGAGVQTNCGRTNKDGVSHPKGEARGYERNIALFHTPQSAGGCQGCRFFFACKGQCPGEGIDGDWRNRSEYCELYTALFETVEAELVRDGITPLSLSPDRPRVERAMVNAWKCGNNLPVFRALTAGEGDCGCGGNGDHGDVPHGDSHGDSNSGHGDAPHGDVPHGDSHGDHTDA